MAVEMRRMVLVTAVVILGKYEMILLLMFFIIFFPCRLGRTECSTLILAVLAILLKESIFYWEVQINKFPSSRRMVCVLVP